LKNSLIGVIGGMGTMATAAFYEKLHSLQDVTAEQEFIDVIIYSKPSIPDRTEFILGRSKENPLHPLIDAAKTLETAGATVLALPCMTSFFFYDELVRETKAKLINFPEKTVKAASEKGYTKVGLLATDGAINAKVLQAKLEAAGIEVLLPEVTTQEMLMKVIYDTKKGKRARDKLPTEITDKLIKKGAQAIVLGCTELCLGSSEDFSCINTLDVLAAATLRECFA